MPSFRMNVTVKQKGQIFNAAATKAQAQQMIIGINEDLALEGVRRVVAYAHRYFQNPTGYYESRVTVDRRQIYRGVWDQRVVYGGWLEGTSSRNRTTRFKGYRIFRTVRQELAQEKERLAQPRVDEFVKKMNS